MSPPGPCVHRGGSDCETAPPGFDDASGDAPINAAQPQGCGRNTKRTHGAPRRHCWRRGRHDRTRHAGRRDHALHRARAGRPTQPGGAARVAAALRRRDRRGDARGLGAGYPVAPNLLAAGLLLYAAVLWRWPIAWLVIVPAALPSFDLAPWTGWSFVEEPDLVVLVTIAGAGAARAAAARRFQSGGRRRLAALAILCCVIGVARGLALPGPPEGSDLAQLRPDNALRVAKGLVLALRLPAAVPAARRRPRADAARLFATGMAAGLGLVGVAALYERLLFPGGLDFEGTYRIVATFSSMHFGGGYVGVYAAMALPFAVALLGRGGLVSAPPLAATTVLGLYTLVVAFARAAYGSAVVGCIVLAYGWLRAARARRAAFAMPLALLGAVVAVVGWAAASDTMAERLAVAIPDLAFRQDLWAQGLALRRPGAATWLFGMGLGSFARTALAELPPALGPGNIVIETGGSGRFARLEPGMPLYLMQKLPILPDRDYRLSFALRAADADGAVVALLCENGMLYAGRCNSASFAPSHPGAWEQVEATIASRGIARRVRFGALRRPTVLAFFVPPGARGRRHHRHQAGRSRGGRARRQRRFRAGPCALVLCRRRAYAMADREPVSDDAVRGRRAWPCRAGAVRRGRRWAARWQRCRGASRCCRPSPPRSRRFSRAASSTARSKCPGSPRFSSRRLHRDGARRSGDRRK